VEEHLQKVEFYRTSSKKRKRMSKSIAPQSLIADERGTDLLEVALMLPVLILMLLGVIEMGRYEALSIVVTNAARAGVQYGAQNLAAAADTTGIRNAALSDGQNISGLQVVSPSGYMGTFVLCGCAGVTPDTTCPATCGAGQQLVYVQVNTKGQFNSLFRYPGIPSPVTINSMAQMQVAQ
jgi:Flp pilus assembly protein TadG